MTSLVGLSLPASAETGIVQIKKGAPAPFDGVVYSVDAHASLVAKLKTWEKTFQLRLSFELQKQDIQCKATLGELKIQLETERSKHKVTRNILTKEKDFLLSRIKKAGMVPWYKSSQFNFWVGFLVSGAIFALSSWAVTELKK